jgi:shikimate kinase
MSVITKGLKLRFVNKVIALCGFMFSGKTETARLIAEKTGRHLYDLDLIIESKTGVTIFDIFKQYGEERFRELEYESLSEILAEAAEIPRGAVIALGGGTAAGAECRELLFKKTGLIYLKASFGEITKRINAAGEAEINSRPLSCDKDFKRLEKLYESRINYYELSGLVINCDGLSVSETAGQIIKAVEDIT